MLRENLLSPTAPDLPLPAKPVVALATINGVPLLGPDELLSIEELRQRACTELLRQAAQAHQLLASGEPPGTDGVSSEATSSAIEFLLERELKIPDPSVDACRRHSAAHAAKYRSGEKVQARHILFAVTPGMDVVALRNRAETCLLDVRCHDGTSGDAFARSARQFSNCPTAADGGALGWLAASECASEFARELFGHQEVGVLPRLVHSRFGLHVVEVLAREPGQQQPFETVRGAVAMSLRQNTYVSALRQYLQLLAGQASVVGVDLEAAATPLVQ